MIFNADLLKIEVGGVVVGLLQNVEFTGDTNMFDVTTKESEGFEQVLPGNGSWTMTADGVTDFQLTGFWDADNFTAAWLAKTELALVLSNGVTGDKQIAGSAYVNNVTITGPQGDTSKYTIAFKGTGKPTITTIV